MRHNYLVLDSRGDPLAHGHSQLRPGESVCQLEVDENIERILDHEYIKLVNMSQDSITIEGRIVKRRENTVWIEIIRTAEDDALRKSLRIPVKFESFLYPVSGKWIGREPIVSHDLSCGGVAFHCGRSLEPGEIAQIVIPVTTQPLLLNLRILRIRPSVDNIPLYASEFVNMVREEENMVCEAVFGLQLQYNRN